MNKIASHKRWSRIAIVMLLILGPTGCFLFEEECGKPSPYFAIQGMSISNATFTGQGPYRYRLAESGESIKYDSFLIKVSFEKTYYSRLNSTAGQYMLYALSCQSPGYLGSQVGIDTMYIVSVHNYNSQYSQNDTLNNIILTNYFTYTEQDFNNFIPLGDYIQQSKGGILGDELDLKIKEPPSDENDLRFKVILILRNGERFEATTNDIRLIK